MVLELVLIWMLLSVPLAVLTGRRLTHVAPRGPGLDAEISARPRRRMGPSSGPSPSSHDHGHANDVQLQAGR